MNKAWTYGGLLWEPLLSTSCALHKYQPGVASTAQAALCFARKLRALHHQLPNQAPSYAFATLVSQCRMHGNSVAR